VLAYFVINAILHHPDELCGLPEHPEAQSSYDQYLGAILNGWSERGMFSGNSKPPHYLENLMGTFRTLNKTNQKQKIRAVFSNNFLRRPAIKPILWDSLFW
jgi:hypothetical protein